MKKILIIIGKLNIGGAERIGRDIGYFLSKSKCEIHYLVFGNEIGMYEQELIDVGCRIHHVEVPSYNYFIYYYNLVSLIRKWNIDVIHAHTMFSSGWAMLAGKACGVPVRIAHSHTIRGHEKRGIIKIVYENVMRQIVIHTATDLVACGKGAGEWFYGAKTFQRHGQLIYNGITLKSFLYNEEIRERIRKQNHLEHHFVIGHVGHFAAVKNQIFLIDLLPEILKIKKNAVLLLLGDGADKQMLLEHIKELQLENHVLLTGNVINVGEYMNAMDVFAFPSLYEGMPLALVEAQANGLPCCISDQIPKDIYLTDLIQVHSLSDRDVWARELCEMRRVNCEKYGKQMYEMGFDTSDMVKKVYELYEGKSL